MVQLSVQDGDGGDLVVAAAESTLVRAEGPGVIAISVSARSTRPSETLVMVANGNGPGAISTLMLPLVTERPDSEMVGALLFLYAGGAASNAWAWAGAGPADASPVGSASTRTESDPHGLTILNGEEETEKEKERR